MLRGNIVNTGSPTYSECGFVYSTIATNPTINDNKIVSSASGATGSFSVYTTELPANKTVYVRAYATNRGGTAYGETTALEPAWIELPAVGIAVQRKDIGYGPWNSVNAMCENSIIGGYTDWRLPSIDELIVLYNNRTNIGGFYTDNASEAYYWSGSQDTTVVSKILYYEFDFWNGTMNSLEIKDFGSFVHKCSGRCVRTLNPTTTNR